MVILEILMVVIGLGAVVYSFKLVEGKRETGTEQSGMSAVDYQREEPPVDWEEKLSELRNKVEFLYEEVDDRMSRMSNEKIMGMSEYSDQVLDKIEKNHGEVVFLYDMMNAKQEEIRQLIKEIDGMKADLHDEAAGEFLKLKEQEKVLDHIRKEIELDSLEYQNQKNELEEEWEALGHQILEEEPIVSVKPEPVKEPESVDATVHTQPESLEKHEPEEDVPEEDAGTEDDSSDNSLTASMFDAEVARIEEEELKVSEEEDGKTEQQQESSRYKPLSEQEKQVNHNDEIVTLYKKGRSVLDISKMLGLGQGEVKFVIDLYNAR